MNITEKKWAAGTLFLGIILGLVGGMAGGFLDRYFSVHFGVAYYIVVVLFFVAIMFYVLYFFEKEIASTKPALVTNTILVKVMCYVSRNENEVLVCMGKDKVKGEDFGRLLGGHVEFGETAEEALRREFREEVGSELTNLKFLKVSENIFTYNGESRHEIDFIYSGDLANKELYDKETMNIIDDPRVEVRWLPLSEIRNGKVKLYPEVSWG